ncbi:hypothetical protein EB796_002343 [Bugula neritina]|uniref:TOR1A n=1 Tax=Bugula neritina TaxID=10212 RepID=A0A7J7KMJ0_BUGNE|nr:hypothetical protein EB796_002343 [Bugula neritina]
MSFQGWTGTGKTLAAQTIVKNLYKEQEKSKYVHWFKATEVFTREDKVKDYQLFVFDEVEKMPEGVLDVLKPFVDFAFPVEGVEYRKAIYILLGTSHHSDIKLIINIYLLDNTYYQLGSLNQQNFVSLHKSYRPLRPPIRKLCKYHNL